MPQSKLRAAERVSRPGSAVIGANGSDEIRFSAISVELIVDGGLNVEGVVDGRVVCEMVVDGTRCCVKAVFCKRVVETGFTGFVFYK